MARGKKPNSDEARAAEERFTADVLARGEAAPAGTTDNELPPGVTHEVVEGEDGKPKVRRRRFSAF